VGLLVIKDDIYNVRVIKINDDNFYFTYTFKRQ